MPLEPGLRPTPPGFRTLAGAHGWTQMALRAAVAPQRRLRDRLLAGRLRAPGFRAGRAPRLLGLSYMQIGADFHAADDLWLEAVVFYGAAGYQPRLTVGAHARLSDRVHIACLSRVEIGDHLLCGSHVLISDHAHGRYDTDAAASDPCVPPAARPLHATGPIQIGNRVWLGDGVAVLGGAEIGDGAVIGAHAVVTGSVPPGTVAVGSPARPIRRWDAGRGGWVSLPRE